MFRGKSPIWRGIAGSGLVKALDGGSRAVLNVAATCAGAGLIVGVVTLTGLGLKFSSIVLAYAGNSLLLTAIYTSLIVWIVGLAVPVTASYIICAVIAAPALIALGVPDFAAHMFIFYYAVLSEVSPPTALSPFAAAAITGGDPYKTTLQCWKYTAPAFLVPFMFVLDPSGTGLLLTGSIKTLGDADWGSIALVTFTAAIGIAALAGGLQGWLFKRTNLAERWMLIVAGFLLVYPKALFDVIGFALVALVVLMQWLRRAGAPPQGGPAQQAAHERAQGGDRHRRRHRRRCRDRAAARAPRLRRPDQLLEERSRSEGKRARLPRGGRRCAARAGRRRRGCRLPPAGGRRRGALEAAGRAREQRRHQHLRRIGQLGGAGCRGVPAHLRGQPARLVPDDRAPRRRT